LVDPKLGYNNAIFLSSSSLFFLSSHRSPHHSLQNSNKSYYFLFILNLAFILLISIYFRSFFNWFFFNFIPHHWVD
jgi:hypothetical protein